MGWIWLSTKLRLFSKYSINHQQNLVLSHRCSNIVPGSIYIRMPVLTAKHLLSTAPKINILSHQLVTIFVLNKVNWWSCGNRMHRHEAVTVLVLLCKMAQTVGANRLWFFWTGVTITQVSAPWEHLPLSLHIICLWLYWNQRKKRCDRTWTRMLQFTEVNSCLPCACTIPGAELYLCICLIGFTD